ncbi:MAG: hypothetical protein JRE20_01270 [Deltaproteobacteria bacterium]|nr:hypothetical protein [Deltaproteobacteria bacterium]
MGKRTVCFLTLTFLIAIFVIPAISSARIYFFDKKLEITGKVEEKIIMKYGLKDWEKGRGKYGYRAKGGRSENPALFRTHFYIDGLYHLFRDEDTIIDIYGLATYYYDLAHQISGKYRRGITAYDLNKYRSPHGEDIIKELYINYVHGPWTLRLGKQQVVWGETSTQRTADVVNPLNMRSHVVGVDDWEDFKKALWMFRGFYQTDLANDLTFEWIWVPSDFQKMDLPPEGSVYNTDYSAGFFANMNRLWKYDMGHTNGLSAGQGGIRIRGYNFDWDWTVLWYNGIDATAVVWDWGNRKNGYTPQTGVGYAMYAQGIGGFNLYAAEYNIAASTGSPLPDLPTTRQFKYYRTNNIGATGAKYFQNATIFGKQIPLKMMMRVEFAYKVNVHFNTHHPDPSSGNWLVDGITESDVVAYGLEISRDWLPSWITRFNGNRSVDTTIGLYQDWILDFSKNLFVQGWNRGGGDRSSTTIQFSCNTDWFKQELDTRFTVAQNVSGNGYIWFSFMYGPGQHWRFTILPRYGWTNAGYPSSGKENMKKKGYKEGTDSNNYVLFKVGYLF